MEILELFFGQNVMGGVDDYPTFKYVLINLFLLVTFAQSTYDKATDWKGNLGWLNGHFSETIFKNSVPQLLVVILVMELLVSVLFIVAIGEIFMNNSLYITKIACALAALTLIFLLIGQRLAKDYAGAFTLTGYFIIAILGII